MFFGPLLSTDLLFLEIGCVIFLWIIVVQDVDGIFRVPFLAIMVFTLDSFCVPRAGYSDVDLCVRILSLFGKLLLLSLHFLFFGFYFFWIGLRLTIWTISR